MAEIEKIGRFYYRLLKSKKDLTETEKAQMKAFEESKGMRPDHRKRLAEYSKSLLTSTSGERKFTITPGGLYHNFLPCWKSVTGKDLIQTAEMKENLRPLFRYFAGDPTFAGCSTVSTLSEPSLDKGLLIVGSNGNGKTSTMQTFRFMFSRIKELVFKSFDANQVVEMYEACESPQEKKDFWRQVTGGRAYFDDVKTERDASNYGKVRLFKDVIERRYNIKHRTYLTCNYRENYHGDLNASIHEFGERYGSRVHDRLFELFNIIHWKGESFRK